MIARAAGLAGLCLGLASSPVWGQGREAARIQVVPPVCAGAFPAFVRALRVELATIGPGCCAVTEPAAAPTGAIALQLDPCDPAAAEVAIVVSGPAAGGAMHRTLPLGDVAPATRPRALAMGVAELVRALVAPAPPPATTTPPAAPTPPAQPPPINDDRDRLRAELAAAFELSAYPDRDTRLRGSRLTGTAGTGRWYGAVDLFAAAGSASFPLGTVAMRLIGGGLSAGPRFTRGRFALAVGATGALGWGWAAGESSRPAVTTDSGSALIASVGVRAALTVPVAPDGRGLGLRATVEGGAVVRGLDARVQDSPPAGVAGSYVIVGLGVAWSQ